MISITVNGEAVQIDSSLSVKQLLEKVDVPSNYLAVEVNGELIPRERHSAHPVKQGDEVEVVTLVGGG